MKVENTFNTNSENVIIRIANSDDLKKVIQLDARVTSIDKVDYWQDTFGRFIGRNGRYVLVAENKTETVKVTENKKETAKVKEKKSDKVEVKKEIQKNKTQKEKK